jgi:3-methyl-2-oxobutanoate hydroxymethyltransferase
VLVIYDALGVTSGRPARFVRNFMIGRDSIEDALKAFVVAVKGRLVSRPEHCF